MTADTLNTLSRIVRLHGSTCIRAGATLRHFELKSFNHYSRRANRLAAMHHRILVAMLPHSELTELLLRRVS